MAWFIRKDRFETGWLRAWFLLTRDERRFVAAIVLIFLIGLTARYLHLRSEKAEAYTPAGLERTGPGERR